MLSHQKFLNASINNNLHKYKFEVGFIYPINIIYIKSDTFFYLNSTLKSQSTSSKPTGPKETSPMYSYTIHKYSIYIYLNPQQTGWTTRFLQETAPPSRSQALTTPRLFIASRHFKIDVHVCALGKQPGNVIWRKLLRYFPRRNIWMWMWHVRSIYLISL